jgi:hypothetical protein
MNPTEAAIYRDLIRLAGSTRWPSGRRMLARERRWLVAFLVLWRSGEYD